MASHTNTRPVTVNTAVRYLEIEKRGGGWELRRSTYLVRYLLDNSFNSCFASPVIVYVVYVGTRHRYHTQPLLQAA